VGKLGFNEGITDVRNKVVFHTLRHTFASWLAISGTPIFTIKKSLGHKDIKMTMRYSHLLPSTKRKAVENVEKMFKEKGIKGKIIPFK
jgi:integrase